MKKQNILKVVLLTIFFAMPLFAGADTLSNESFFGIVSAAFIAGILLTFTPCVLPMIPILSSVIAGEGEKISKAKAFQLSFAYVLGTAVTYAVMGALAGATGEQLQSYFQNVWAMGAMSLVFVVMALGMFGAFTIQMPSFLQSRLEGSTHNLKGGKFFAVFLLGLVSALILGACVSPVLISFLSVAIATSDPLLGAQTMFALALGMGVPLMLMGVGAGYLLPKAGAWMDGVKHFFGILLIGVAVSIFSELQLLSSLILWGVYFIGIAVYIGAVDFTEQALNGWQKVKKIAAVLLFVWGIITLVGGAQGNSDLLLPLKNEQGAFKGAVTSTAVEKESGLPFEQIKNLDEFDAEKAKALREHKPMVLFFHSSRCKVCEKLKSTTLQDPKIRKILKKKYIALMVDMTDKSDVEAYLIKKRLKVFGPPAFVIIDSDGNILEDEIMYGYQSVQNLFDALDMNAE